MLKNSLSKVMGRQIGALFKDLNEGLLVVKIHIQFHCIQMLPFKQSGLDWTLICLQIWPFVYPSEEVNVSLFAKAAYCSYFPLFKEGFSAKVVLHQLPTDFLKQRDN